MTYSIKKVAVIGSGVMGSGIAAHLANAGLPVIMFDRVPDSLTDKEKKQGLSLEDRSVRNRIVAEGKKKLLKQKPSPITSKKSLELIQVANLEDDLALLSEADWIVEVIVENLEAKKELFKKVDAHRSKGTIITSNTSGISVEAMISEASEDMQEHFLGTHFFNPPRYLKLLEVIPTEKTKAEVLSFMKLFGENVLGKGVVEAKDTPNFIANRIGTYGLLVTVQEMKKQGLSVGEVDSITGPLIGRPKSATFRTLDVVGIDTFYYVANNVYHHVSDPKEKEIFTVPDFLKEMIEKGWIGAKSGKGFYEKKKDRTIVEINPNTLEYQERKKLKTNAVEAAKQEKGLSRKMKALINQKGDKASDFIWSIIKPVLVYSADLVGEIADDVVSIDDAMKWGFGWELGPFEIWDAIGVSAAVERIQDEGTPVPSWVLDMLEEGNETFYKQEKGEIYFFHNDTYKQKIVNKKEISLAAVKEQKGVIKKNTGASLIDMGDDVALLEFHSKSNAIGLDIIQMVNESIEEVNKNYKGLVIGNQGKNFCVGANLAMMLMEAQDDNIFELDLVIRQFQNMTMNIKYADKPVVVAPFNMTLGGGAEVSLPAAAIQASPETYMGLVEFGVGLIPGGGGTKELYLKELRNLPEGVDLDLTKVANDVFEKVATAKVSTSAREAMENGYLNKNDRISRNPDHILYDAKKRVLSLANEGYEKPAREKIPVVGEAGYAAMVMGAKSLHYGGYASEHDLKIAERLAYVLSGGRIKEGTEIDEQVMLDLEREAFLNLIAEPLTQQRMQHMLVKGKPLRN
ncbi:3-hydroxyacyl-CoA dehydrogenase/enoyl-CoA hydratase family protein [Oceanobacillus jeddahense]|uniref:3-hydroxyacyl-CoA dehydrogenase/enoyl-CoA hydratase family protein n=1 Tax=Oceanobacillus jeddahense TaxID=1462527 RepID=A0ABY5JNV3_9BACI|nr:3-hydroxyacyl-CoA dehydrogenase/enoyl-CoA hydratase family protein [Oceanobacillus jeddahense]UUI01985.1 3-hydroxyacyl-CoA dehydrogenase/enoyl-CoA hydratase family protein [Oceanobacillus jeddahense]